MRWVAQAQISLRLSLEQTHKILVLGIDKDRPLAPLTMLALVFQPKSLCAGPFLFLECNAGAFLCLGSTCLVITSIA